MEGRVDPEGLGVELLRQLAQGRHVAGGGVGTREGMLSRIRKGEGERRLRCQGVSCREVVR